MTNSYATPIAVAGALLAACMFGCAAALQHRVASSVAVSGSAGRAPASLGLVRRAPWLLAVALAAGSYGVEALALAFGPVALVAPIAATDLLFALPLAARLGGRRLGRREWVAAAAVACGVGLFLAAATPAEGLVGVPSTRWLAIITAVAVVVTSCLCLAATRSGTASARLLAVAGGALFALLTALTKSAAEVARTDGVAAALRGWQPYAVLVVGVAGLFIAQAAYQAAPLSASLPIIDILEPVGAVLIGATVLGEQLTHSTTALVLQFFGALAAIVGIAALETAPAERADDS